MDGNIRSAIKIMNDIALEARTVYRNIEYDDPMSDNMVYIEDMTKRAIEKLEETE